MPRLELILAVHDHQPVGNFEHVLEDATRLAYRPFLETMERHPGVRFCLHQSGPVWEWFEARHPDLLDLVRSLHDRGQVELLGGGHYEPILPVIPPADAQGQLGRLADWLESRFGARPRGAWLAERVWEPHVAATLARAGVEYTVLDDVLFAAAGVPEPELDGPWVVDGGGAVLRVFPIRRRLRELVPFRPPEETFAWLGERAAAALHADAVAVLADDGEKFGLWEGTHAWCYRDGWLERFLTGLEANGDWLGTTTFSACLDRVRGRTALPAGAYAEMMEWALPPAAQRALARARARSDGDPEVQALLCGGHWRQFLARYPEGNWMHQRMLGVSARVAARAATHGAADPVAAGAREDLWRAQCNCAYWHGLFGGLYLPHLRAGVHGALLRAEAALDAAEPPPAVEVRDVDADGNREVVLRSPTLQAIVAPAEGGAVFELADLRRAIDLVDVLARREEAYHEIGRVAPASGAGDGTAPLATGTTAVLAYDAHRHGAFVDRVLPAGARAGDAPACIGREIGVLAGAAYDWRHDGAVLVLERRTPLALPGTPLLHLRKELGVAGAALVGRYRLAADAPVEFVFAVEIAVGLLAGDAPDRYVEVPGLALAAPRLGAGGVLAGVDRVDLVDGWRDLRVSLSADAPAEVWRLPVETWSMSERGLQTVHQGLVLLWTWRVTLAPDEPWRRALAVEVGPR